MSLSDGVSNFSPVRKMPDSPTLRPRNLQPWSMAIMNIRNLQPILPLALAPMVGLTHSAGRSLIQEIGGVGLLFSEMLAAARLPHDNPAVSPMLVRHATERPLFYQMFLASEEPVEKAVARLEELGADGIDINLGCPAPQLRRSGSGGHLADDTRLVAQIVRQIRLRTELPVTAKIRLGRQLESRRYLEFCRMLEAEGIDMLTIHARLHGEKFCRPPRWQWIRFAKDVLTIPVCANGGIFTVNDALRCLEITGADGLMLGRGAFENPYLFAEIASTVYGIREGLRWPTRDRLYFRFVELLEERFRPERRLGRLKQFTSYFSRSFLFGHQLATGVQTSQSMEEANERAIKFFAGVEPGELLPPGRPVPMAMSRLGGEAGYSPREENV